MHFSKAVVKYRIPILIIAVLLMIPSVLGMIGTRINYDMLDYLPDDMDTVIGQNELLEDFGKEMCIRDRDYVMQDGDVTLFRFNV